MNAPISRLMEAALNYADLGYAVFPCAPGSKRPLTEHGHLEATTDWDQIEQWWTQRPQANIGIATSGLLVLDVDAEAKWLAEDPDKCLALASAPLSLTANGGRHYIFRQPEGRSWRNTTGKLAPHVDTRADGGYIVVSPSVLEGGKSYRWADEMELDSPPDRLPEPPAWLIAELDETASEGHTLAPDVASAAEANQIPSGQRNDTLARLAGTMRRVGMSQAEILAALSQTNSDRCDPPLDDSEVARIAANVARYEPDQISVALVEDHWGQSQNAAERKVLTAGVHFETITSRELDEGEYELSFLIDGLLVRGQPGIIAGTKKTLKTNSSVDLALSLSSAGMFLGRFNVPEAVRVGVMSGESGAATIQETARRIAHAKFGTLSEFEDVFWCFDVPQLGQTAHMMALEEFITQRKLDVLILDPTYLMMLGLGDNAGNLFVVGQFLKSLGELSQATGCTPILCHHLRKNVAAPYEPAELEDIAWAGFQEFVRQWILLNRRVKYDPDNGGHHELWMSVGGSAGHSGLWALNVDEGTIQDEGGRRWEVEVLSAPEAEQDRIDERQRQREAKKQQQQAELQEQYRQAAIDALSRFPDGETERKLREIAGLSGSKFGPILSLLIREGVAEACEITKQNHQTYDGYRLTKSHWDSVGHTGTVPLSQ